MVFDREKFLSQFRTEVLERVEAANRCLVELEKYPENMDIYETVKREFHTLKGITSLMGFDKTSIMFHKLEDLFRNKEKGTFLKREVYDFLFKCIDTVYDTFRKNIIDENSIEELIQTACTIFGGNSSENKNIIVDNGRIGKNEQIQVITEDPKSDIKHILQKQNDKIKIDVTQLKDLLNFSNEILMSKSILKDIIGKVEKNVHEGKIIDQDSFDLSMLRLNDVYEKIDRYSTAISYLAVNMRMVSLDSLFNLYIRPVREMAKTLGVEVDLNFQGEKTLLDKDILKHIVDPVLHILRNAVDHGIEPVEDRKSKGKNRFGTILFNAYQRSSRVFIEISDDGRGIDLKKLRNKIFQRGLAGMKEVNKFSEEKLLSFLFMHGFSTNDTVNMLSGRGVGLDVVKEQVEAINGSVKISSVIGKGTTVTLILPLTVSVTESLLVEAGKEVFAIPTDYVKEVKRLKPELVREMENGKIECIIDNEKVSAINLSKYLNINTTFLPDNKGLIQAVVVSSSNFRYCIIVDKILTYIDTVVKPVLSVKGQLKAFLGATVTGEGRTVLVLDIPAIKTELELNKKNVNPVHGDTSQKYNFNGVKVLLAEDSANIAEVEKKILESVGFDVALASDGKSAYDMAVKNKYDIILSDLLMPGMNGIELVKLLRNEKSYVKTPIVMVTSRNNPADKANAIAAGANEYVIKSELTSDNIISVIKKLINIKSR